jgi:hypothetical protein
LKRIFEKLSIEINNNEEINLKKITNDIWDIIKNENKDELINSFINILYENYKLFSIHFDIYISILCFFNYSCPFVKNFFLFF